MIITRSRNGFSLVELSIVLVILGLLTGGILAGQSLIRAAEIRKVITTRDKYTTAIQTFRDKYFALPGDMPNATAFWGRKMLSSCPGTESSLTIPGTCGGDGNGNADWMNVGNSEHSRVWEHLSRAGLIEGSYSYSATSGLTEAQEIGVSTPPFLSQGSVRFGYIGPGMISPDIWLKTGHFMRFGVPMTGSSELAGGIVSPPEAYNIDIKVDDGMPGLGKTLSFATWTGTGSVCNTTPVAQRCVSSFYVGNSGAGVNYNLQAASGFCSTCVMNFGL